MGVSFQLFIELKQCYNAKVPGRSNSEALHSIGLSMLEKFISQEDMVVNKGAKKSNNLVFIIIVSFSESPAVLCVVHV